MNVPSRPLCSNAQNRSKAMKKVVQPHWRFFSTTKSVIPSPNPLHSSSSRYHWLPRKRNGASPRSLLCTFSLLTNLRNFWRGNGATAPLESWPRSKRSFNDAPLLWSVVPLILATQTGPHREHDTVYRNEDHTSSRRLKCLHHMVEEMRPSTIV